MNQVKRFYQDVALGARDECFVVLLDGKPAKTLHGTSLHAPTHALAAAIATEWRDQREHVEQSTMALTGFANSAIDRVSRNRGQVIDHILGFGRSDLLCYRAEQPAALAARQKELWDPLLEWARTKHGLRLMADAGVSYIEQPVDAILRMQELVSMRDDFALAPFDLAAALTGSFVIALALVEGHVAAEQAFAAAQVEEIYQAEKWGRDAEAEAGRNRLITQLKAAEQFVRLVRK